MHTIATTGSRPRLAGAVLGAAMLAGLCLSLLTAGHGQVSAAAANVSTIVVTTTTSSLSTAPDDKSGTRWG